MRSPINDINRAWVRWGKKETLCTCHRLFGDLNCASMRESLKVPITEIIQTYRITNMLNIEIFKTACSYSDTAVIHRY